MSQLKNYIILTTDLDGQVATFASTSRAYKEAGRLADDTGQTVYVSKTNVSDEYGGSEQGDTELACFEPTK